MSALFINNQPHQEEFKRRTVDPVPTTTLPPVPVSLVSVNQELEVKSKTYEVNLQAMIKAGGKGEVTEISRLVLPDGREVTITKAIPATITESYSMNDDLKIAVVSKEVTLSENSSLVEKTSTTVAYVAGQVTRVPVLASINANSRTVRCKVIRSFLRPDQTTLTTEEITEDLSASVACVGYEHSDATHSSTELRRFTVTHEGVQVSGDFPAGATVPHSVVLGVAGQEPDELVVEDGCLNAHFPVHDTYTRPDNSTYTTDERSYAQRWTISEPTDPRHISSEVRQLREGTTHWLTGESTKVYANFKRTDTYQRRIATKPDGSVHVIKDWWYVTSNTAQCGDEWCVKN